MMIHSEMQILVPTLSNFHIIMLEHLVTQKEELVRSGVEWVVLTLCDASSLWWSDHIHYLAALSSRYVGSESRLRFSLSGRTNTLKINAIESSSRYECQNAPRASPWASLSSRFLSDTQWFPEPESWAFLGLLFEICGFLLIRRYVVIGPSIFLAVFITLFVLRYRRSYLSFNFLMPSLFISSQVLLGPCYHYNHTNGLGWLSASAARSLDHNWSSSYTRYFFLCLRWTVARSLLLQCMHLHPNPLPPMSNSNLARTPNLRMDSPRLSITRNSSRCILRHSSKRILSSLGMINKGMDSSPHLSLVMIRTVKDNKRIIIRELRRRESVVT